MIITIKSHETNIEIKLFITYFVTFQCLYYESYIYNDNTHSLKTSCSPVKMKLFELNSSRIEIIFCWKPEN